MIFLFILQELHVLETKGCTLYRRALQLLQVSFMSGTSDIGGFYLLLLTASVIAVF